MNSQPKVARSSLAIWSSLNFGSGVPSRPPCSRVVSVWVPAPFCQQTTVFVTSKPWLRRRTIRPGLSTPCDLSGSQVTSFPGLAVENETNLEVVATIFEHPTRAARAANDGCTVGARKLDRSRDAGCWQHQACLYHGDDDARPAL